MGHIHTTSITRSDEFADRLNNGQPSIRTRADALAARLNAANGKTPAPRRKEQAPLTKRPLLGKE